MSMRGLTVIVAEPSPMRLRSAFGLLLTQAALRGQARLFLDTDAVALLRRPVSDARDPVYAEAGLPTLAGLVDEALDAGVRIIICQAGMAMIGAEPADFDPRIEAGGMVVLLAAIGDDRLVVA